MSNHGYFSNTARRVLWLGALGTVLAGLFGMHGLGSHGMSGMGAAHAVTAGSVMAVPAGHDVMSSPAAPKEGTATRAITTVASGYPTTEVGMVIECVAVLAVALLALLRMLRGRRAGLRLRMPTRRLRAPAFLGRDVDPPCLFDLSIQRC